MRYTRCERVQPNCPNWWKLVCRQSVARRVRPIAMNQRGYGEFCLFAEPLELPRSGSLVVADKKCQDVGLNSGGNLCECLICGAPHLWHWVHHCFNERFGSNFRFRATRQLCQCVCRFYPDRRVFVLQVRRGALYTVLDFLHYILFLFVFSLAFSLPI